MSDSGSIRSVKLFGIFFEASGDTDLNFVFGQYEVEGQPTTGQANMKSMKRVETITGIELQTSDAKRELLKQKMDALVDGDLEVQIASGSTYTASGRVNSTGYATADNKLTVDLIPRGRWTPVIV